MRYESSPSPSIGSTGKPMQQILQKVRSICSISLLETRILFTWDAKTLGLLTDLQEGFDLNYVLYWIQGPLNPEVGKGPSHRHSRQTHAVVVA